jgi:hypothetical protein
MEYVTCRQKQILLILDAHREGMAFRQIRIELAEPVPDWELKNELTALKNLDSLQIRAEEEGLFGL